MKDKRSLEVENIHTQICMRIIKNLNLYKSCKGMIGFALYKSKYNETPNITDFYNVDVNEYISHICIVMVGEYILGEKGYENKLKNYFETLKILKKNYSTYININTFIECLKQYKTFIRSKDCEIILKNFDKYGFSL